MLRSTWNCVDDVRVMGIEVQSSSEDTTTQDVVEIMSRVTKRKHSDTGEDHDSDDDEGNESQSEIQSCDSGDDEQIDDSLPNKKPRKKRRYITISMLQELAKEYSGKCLATTIPRTTDSVEWECAQGHQFRLVLRRVIHDGTWCEHCTGRKTKRVYTIDDMKKLAEEKGGQCLSTVYTGTDSNLDWQCNEGHKFSARVGGILHSKAWCLECKGKKTPRVITLETLQEIATARGGRCLATEYRNTNEHVRWECQFGHQWNATAGNVLYHATWCGDCGGSSRELIVRSLLARMFDVPFPSCRPEWLLNEGTDRRLELDCFNEAMSLAVEVDGGQHERVVDYFQRTRGCTRTY